MFYYPRSKARNGKAKRVLVQRPNPAMPGTKQMPDWTCRSRWSPSDSHHAPLKASGTLTQVICDTERVWHVTAPMECLWAARGTCLQETTFPNTLLWRKQNNQPGFKPLFLRALRSFKVNQLITQLALKKKKNSSTNSVPLGLGEDGWPQKCVLLAHCLSRAPRMVPA